MKRKNVFLLLIFGWMSFIMSGQQQTEMDQGLIFEVKALTLLGIPDPTDTPYDTDYEKQSNTFLMGLGFETNYYFDESLGIGFGIGHEIVSQPKFTYIPIYLNLLTTIGEDFSGVLQFGVHKGNVDNSGFLFRAGFGIRVPINKYFEPNFILTYSFQNIYKSFENSGRSENYYNFKSFGITISLKIKYKKRTK